MADDGEIPVEDFDDADKYASWGPEDLEESAVPGGVLRVLNEERVEKKDFVRRRLSSHRRTPSISRMKVGSKGLANIAIEDTDEPRKGLDPPTLLVPNGGSTTPRRASCTPDMVAEDASSSDLSEDEPVCARLSRSLSVHVAPTLLFSGPEESEEEGVSPLLKDPLLFCRPNSHENILFEDDTGVGATPLVKAATLEKLVEHLTNEKRDAAFVDTFFLTYHSFTTPMELLELLLARFEMKPPAHHSRAAWVSASSGPVRLRVASVLKTWILKHYEDFCDCPVVVDHVLAFVDGRLKDVMPAAAQNLRSTLMAHVTVGPTSTSLLTMSTQGSPPLRIAPVLKGHALTILDIDPVEIARQLCIKGHSLFKQLDIRECAQHGWIGEDSKDRAPTITALIEHFEDSARFASGLVVMVPKMSVRAAVISALITAAEQCLALHNFSAVTEIVAGLQATPVHRLKATWALVPPHRREKFQELVDLVSRGDHNYTPMREALEMVGASPAVPYLGMFLTDLTFLQDGIPDFVSSEIVLQYDVSHCLPLLDRSSEASDDDSKHYPTLTLDVRCVLEDAIKTILETADADVDILPHDCVACVRLRGATSKDRWVTVMSLPLTSIPCIRSGAIFFVHPRRRAHVFRLEDGREILLEVDITDSVKEITITVVQHFLGKEENPLDAAPMYLLKAEAVGTRQWRFLTPEVKLCEQNIPPDAVFTCHHRFQAAQVIAKANSADSVDHRLLELLFEECRLAICTGRQPVVRGLMEELAPLHLHILVQEYWSSLGEAPVLTGDAVPSLLGSTDNRGVERRGSMFGLHTQEIGEQAAAKNLDALIQIVIPTAWRERLSKREVKKLEAAVTQRYEEAVRPVISLWDAMLQYVSLCTSSPTYAASLYHCKWKMKGHKRTDRLVGVNSDKEFLIVVDRNTAEVVLSILLVGLTGVQLNGHDVVLDIPPLYAKTLSSSMKSGVVRLICDVEAEAAALQQDIILATPSPSTPLPSPLSSAWKELGNHMPLRTPGGTVARSRSRTELQNEGTIELINFAKRRKVALVLATILQYQALSYNFLREETIQRFLHESIRLSDAVLASLSYKCEPK